MARIDMLRAVCAFTVGKSGEEMEVVVSFDTKLVDLFIENCQANIKRAEEGHQMSMKKKEADIALLNARLETERLEAARLKKDLNRKD